MLDFFLVVLALFLGKGVCDSTCPNGMTNITGQTSGEIAYPSSGKYGVNETKCWRIEVPKPYISIGIYYKRHEIEVCRSCACDMFSITDNYASLPGGSCGRNSESYAEYSLQLSGDVPQNTFNGENIYVFLRTDDTGHYKGFKISYIAGSRDSGIENVLNATEGETIEFGTPKAGIKNYQESHEETWFLIVPEGRQVQITFKTFELEQSDNCEKDYVEIREAYFKKFYDPRNLEGDYGAIISKPICGSSLPGPFQSKGNMVWVHFVADSNSTTTYKGFTASFTAGQGRLSSSNLLSLLIISVVIMVTSKESVL